jgi:hypothetical protein
VVGVGTVVDVVVEVGGSMVVAADGGVVPRGSDVVVPEVVEAHAVATRPSAQSEIRVVRRIGEG